ncbi:MAG TPA: glutaredoxin domain-containing protein [Candidatus Omnitrophota bacterium]|nr:glutaredoxin domain-containing protein [Candidatus Omnitrophota bacterium]
MIKIYSTETCPYCVAAKQFFKDNHLEYTEFDVGSDRAAAEEMIARSGQLGVPVIDIDGTIVVGFNRPKIKELLKLS